MRTLFDGDRFEVAGLTFEVKFEHDFDSGRPWENADGHGPVREVGYSHDTGRISKRPGERILNHNPGRNDYIWAYDWAEACRLAKKDGWNAPPYDAPNRIERAVQADFDYLAGWVNDDWRYVGVVVTLLVPDEDGELVPYEGSLQFDDSLWGVDDAGEYATQVAHELAEGMAAVYLAEQEEAQYWAERDTQTMES